MQHGLASPFTLAPPSCLSGLTVLQIIPALDAGASERTALDLADALTEAGARALVATTGGALVGELQARGGVWIPFPADSRNPLAMANNVRKLRDLIRVERPSAIHAHGQAAAWVALGAAQLTGTPLVTSFGDRPTARQAVTHHYDSVLARGDVVLVPSEHAGAAAVAAFPWVRERLRIVPAGVDVHRFSAAAVDPGRVEAVRAAWGVEPDRRVVLLPVPPSNGSGHSVLVEAAALLRAEGCGDVLFVLSGEPSPRAGAGDIDRLIVQHGLSGTVRSVGACDDRAAAFLAASLVVLPCLQPEACRLPALEAQAMGVPVVISEGGNAADAVLSPPQVGPRHRTGWRVPPGDAEALASAVRDALALGASARDVLATRARVHVERSFSRDRMTDATLDAYVALIEGRMLRTRAGHG